MLEKNFDVVIEFSREKQLQNDWFSDCTITVESDLKLSFGCSFSYVFDICRCNYGHKSWKNEVEKVFVTRDGYD